jgi:hypothetical protein
MGITKRAMSKKPKRPPPPASLLEAAAIASAEKAYRLLESKVATRVSIDDLEGLLLDRLRDGGLAITEKAVYAAEHEDDEMADRCLRQVYAEKADAPGGLMSGQLNAFGVRAVNRPPVTRGPGAHTWYENFKRDVLVGALVQWTCLEFGLRKSRSRASRREQMPSGGSVVAAALYRCGIELSEKRIGEIHDGLAGVLGEALIAYFSKA